nr:PREDICTED: uncharacterized protein LOC100878965 isoform X2 [Megachile rotundata]XP_012141009.1 PREDICTED: uncharacterized protein LOC100878965 isoform X2 [Megachile rotundata]XP_012141010.1 PREDICTED: uncharacterized protein LOC100878965 isoform X2 [Megachile rotundata]
MQFEMIFVVVAATLLQGGYGGFVSVRMPYLNPAGVTYIDNVQPEAHLYGVPARVEAQHVGYAAAQVPAVAAVPFVKHVPTVSHVPVTKIEAQHALLEKQLDVVKPAVSTRKFEVRRPAIQKQFFDIEERVVVRPAGSAVVELDQPTSKTPKGPAVIQSLYPQFEAGPSVAPPVVSSTPSPNDDETVVVENPDFRNRAAQNQANALGAQTRTNINGAQSGEPFVAHDPTPGVVVSPQSSPEQDRQNQNKLLELLTARGNVAEVGFNNLGLSKSVGDAGQIRGRVISATPAPEYADPADERVSTRRVVVSRPIETLQEVNVVEPATKIERVSVHQPTLIKTARLDHVQVHGSVPVVGKALAPAIAHAAVPVYQKTVSPAYSYEYYH